MITFAVSHSPILTFSQSHLEERFLVENAVALDENCRILCTAENIIFILDTFQGVLRVTDMFARIRSPRNKQWQLDECDGGDFYWLPGDKT